MTYQKMQFRRLVQANSTTSCPESNANRMVYPQTYFIHWWPAFTKPQGHTSIYHNRICIHPTPWQLPPMATADRYDFWVGDATWVDDPVATCTNPKIHRATAILSRRPFLSWCWKCPSAWCSKPLQGSALASELLLMGSIFNTQQSPQLDAT